MGTFNFSYVRNTRSKLIGSCGGGAGLEEPYYCQSTLPSHFGSVLVAHSRCLRQAMPPPLPAGEKGFLPKVRWQRFTV